MNNVMKGCRYRNMYSRDGIFSFFALQVEEERAEGVQLTLTGIYMHGFLV